jgi:hypothetical protein
MVTIEYPGKQRRYTLYMINALSKKLIFYY